MKMMIRSGVFCLFVVLQLWSVLAQDCSLIVPANPLTAQGLATPYLLVSNDPNNPCSQAGDGASFVQGAVINLDTGVVSVYNPLVIDQGTTPAVSPVVPTLPARNIVGLWFGTNGDSLTLLDNGSGSLTAGNCVDGVAGSIFGQFSYCNAPNFFNAANSAILKGKLQVPRIGTASDGFACPTTRDFFVVDQDQSDNVVTNYLLTSSGKVAQNTAANRNSLKKETVISNGSDEGLVVALDNALGCQPWKVNDLADPGNTLASLPMNELLAAYRQSFPVALVPAGDPMVLVNGKQDLTKLNLYRQGVDQAPVSSLSAADTTIYCKKFGIIFLTRMATRATKRLLSAQSSPDTAVGNNLYTFMANRFSKSFGPDNLNCSGLLNIEIPMELNTNQHGVTVSANVDHEILNNTAIWEVPEQVASSSTTLFVPIYLVSSLVFILMILKGN